MKNSLKRVDLTPANLLRLVFTLPQECERDAGFRRTLIRTGRSGLRAAGLLGIIGPVVFLAVHLLFLGKEIRFAYGGYDQSTLFVTDKLIILLVGITCLVASFREQGARLARLILGIAMFAVTFVAVADDVARGELSHTTGYLALIFFIGIATMPYRPWQALAVGVALMVASALAVFSVPGSVDMAAMNIGTDTTVFLAVWLIFGTGISALLYYSRYNLYLVRCHERAARKEAALTARRLDQTLRTLRQTQTQLIQAEKMASLGKLVAGTAHEMNSPLGAAMASSDVLGKALGKLESELQTHAAADSAASSRTIRLISAAKESLMVILRSGQKIEQIVTSMRAFARLDQSTWQMTQVNDCIRDTLSVMSGGLSPQMTIVQDLGELPLTWAAPASINQVLLNIIRNAIEASGSDERIVVTSRASAGEIEIVITDNGKGISPELLEKICDPGFTTKGPGVGIGLGLATCCQIIREHHGSMGFDSKIGEGTTVTIRLPIQQIDKAE